MIDGGYIILARKILGSDLMDKPPRYLKLWVWILVNAEWRADGELARGQLHTTIDEMREGVSWHVGYRKITPTKKEIRSAYEFFLRKSDEGREGGTPKGAMIGTTKGTRGMVITVLNYCYYQNTKNYERHYERHDERHDDFPTKGEGGAHVLKEEEREEEKNKEKDNTAPQGVGDVVRGHGRILAQVLLNDGTTGNICERAVAEWERNFKWIDARAEAISFAAFLSDKPPDERPTRKGYFGLVSGRLNKLNREALTVIKARDPNFDPSDPTGDKAAEEQRERTRSLVQASIQSAAKSANAGGLSNEQ